MGQAVYPPGREAQVKKCRQNLHDTVPLIVIVNSIASGAVRHPQASALKDKDNWNWTNYVVKFRNERHVPINSKDLQLTKIYKWCQES